MSAWKVVVRYEASEVQWELERGSSLEEEVLPSLCAALRVIHSPSHWALYVPRLRLYLSQAELRPEAALPLEKGEAVELRVEPGRQAAEVVALLGREEKQKLALYQLFKTQLQDPSFLAPFLAMGGLSAVVHCVLHCSGSTQALALRSLAAALRAAQRSAAEAEATADISPELFAVLLGLCQSETLSTSKSALEVVSQITAPSFNGAQPVMLWEELELAFTDVASDWAQEPFQFLLYALQADDIDNRVAALGVIDNLLELCPSRTELLERLDELGLLQTIQEHCLAVQQKQLVQELLRHQKLRLAYLEEAKSTSFDSANKEHLALLERIWTALYPQGARKYPGPVGEHWTSLGFQQKDPKSDLRGAGLLALHNMLYVCDVYGDQFLSLCESQQGKSIEEPYYPVATAAINVTALLYDKLYAKCETVLPFVFEPGDPFEEVYCSTVFLVDRIFHKLNSTYMEFTSKVIPVVHNRVQNSLDLKPKSLDAMKELIETTDEEEFASKMESLKVKAFRGKSGSGGGPVLEHRRSEVATHGLPFVKAEELPELLERIKAANLKLISQTKVQALKDGIHLRALRSANSTKQSTITLRDKGLHLSEEWYFFRLSRNEQEFEWATCPSPDGVPSPLDNSCAVALFSDVLYGSQCPILKSSKSTDDSSSFAWTLQRREKQSPLLQREDTAFLTFVVMGVEGGREEQLCTWVNGLKALFQKPLVFEQVVNEELKSLVDAEMIIRRQDLREAAQQLGKAAEEEPPAVPPEPDNFDFVELN